MKLTAEAKKLIIKQVFSNTLIDQLFIQVASELGYTKYYTNLIDLDDMTDKQLEKCYERTCEVALGINALIS
jgi:hypothetical protein